MVGLELEVMAKKLDRFGWDRDRNSAAHDRLVTDWIAALADYTLDEIRAACRQWVRDNPRKMCNEGDIRRLIQAARREEMARYQAATSPQEDAPPKKRPTPEEAHRIMVEAGFKPRKFGGGDDQ